MREQAHGIGIEGLDDEDVQGFCGSGTVAERIRSGRIHSSNGRQFGYRYVGVGTHVS
jgi:hypothetical protein